MKDVCEVCARGVCVRGGVVEYFAEVLFSLKLYDVSSLKWSVILKNLRTFIFEVPTSSREGLSVETRPE